MQVVGSEQCAVPTKKSFIPFLFSSSVYYLAFNRFAFLVLCCDLVLFCFLALFFSPIPFLTISVMMVVFNGIWILLFKRRAKERRNKISSLQKVRF